MHRVNVSLYATALTVLISRGKTRLLQNTPLRSHAWRGQNSQQDAQKGQTSHPPNHGGISPSRPESAKTDSSPQDAPCPMQGRNSVADPRFTFHDSCERCENKAGGLFQHPANLWALVGTLRPIRKGTPWIVRHTAGESGSLYLRRHQGRPHTVHDRHRQSTPGERRHHGV